MLEAKFGENPFKTDFNKYNQINFPEIKYVKSLIDG